MGSTLFIYVSDLLPALRARVPRGLGGYAPLWALLGLRVAGPPPGIAGEVGSRPHSLKIDRRS